MTATDTTETVATFTHDGRTYQIDHLGIAVAAQYGEYAVYQDGNQIAAFEVEDAYAATEHRKGLPDSAELIELGVNAVIDAADEDSGQPRCRRCGCTEIRACLNGCSWVDDPEEKGELCSACLPAILAQLGTDAEVAADPDNAAHLEHITDGVNVQANCPYCPASDSEDAR